MGYQLPVRGRQQVELTREGVRGLIKGEILPWSVVRKVEGDDETVTFHIKPETEFSSQGPFVVNIAKDNELQVLNLRAIVEKHFFDNDLATYNKKTEAWDGLPEFDFSKLEDFELQAQPAAPAAF